MRDWTGLERLSDDCLCELAQGAMFRIGSHGGDHDGVGRQQNFRSSTVYINHQQSLLDAIEKEFDRRDKKVKKYRVEVQRTFYCRVYLDIEAQDLEEAREKAYEEGEGYDIDDFNLDEHWVSDETEVVDWEEIKEG